MDRLREMEIFVRVVETGSFSAAAGDLKLGQLGISKTIAGLEERLGARLLVRSTRQPSPTDASVAFYERAIRAVAKANEAEAAAQGVGGSRRTATNLFSGNIWAAALGSKAWRIS